MQNNKHDIFGIVWPLDPRMEYYFGFEERKCVSINICPWNRKPKFVLCLEPLACVSISINFRTEPPAKTHGPRRWKSLSANNLKLIIIYHGHVCRPSTIKWLILPFGCVHSEWQTPKCAHFYCFRKMTKQKRLCLLTFLFASSISPARRWSSDSSAI